MREPLTALVFAVWVHIGFFNLMRIKHIGDHRRGIAWYRARSFAKAAAYFEASYAYLEKHAWVDRFRWLVLGKGSAMSYREMDLCNAALCYSQCGDAARAMALYEQALREFPECTLARVSLYKLKAGRDPLAAAREEGKSAPAGGAAL